MVLLAIEHLLYIYNIILYIEVYTVVCAVCMGKIYNCVVYIEVL